ncbi:MAG: hypothetical protein H7069_10705 [Phormidesmis sp. FL-bin-119]|nr:hypothetical protein [Pedobacter sp.]
MNKKFLFLFFAFTVFTSLARSQSKYSIIIKGGHVIDPKNSIDGLMDIAVTDNRIVAVAKYIDPKMGIQGANPIVRPSQLSDNR